MNNKNIAVMIAAVWVALASSPVLAASGTVSGCVVYNDTRQECSAAVGSRRPCSGANGNKPLREAYVRLSNAGGTGTPGSGTTSSSTGCFSFAWSDAFCWGFPCSYELVVELRNPSDFRVRNPSGVQYSNSVTVSVASSNANLGTFSVGNTDHAQVYATANEYWDTIVDGNATLSARMTDIKIHANTSDAGSYTFDHENIYLVAGRGSSRPLTTVAHEIGHTTAFKALGRYSIAYTDCNPAHAYLTQSACDKVAWSEGIANFFATVWGFTNNAPDSGVTFGTQGGVGVTPAICNTAAQPWRVEACQTAALWDLLDDPSADDDVFDDANNIAFGDIIASLDSYISNCTGDRCDSENGPDAQNHHDFHRAFKCVATGAQVLDLFDVYSSQSLIPGGEEAFSNGLETCP